MSNYGFVYLLTNSAMPGIYKIGCTERSPHRRAEELSNGSGVPLPFNVTCYIEVADCQAVEAQFHRWLAFARLNPSREFFRNVGEDYLIGMFCHYPGRLSFTDVCVWDIRPFEDDLPDSPYIGGELKPYVRPQNPAAFEFDAPEPPLPPTKQEVEDADE